MEQYNKADMAQDAISALIIVFTFIILIFVGGLLS